jgi:predicted phosphodiesterase
VRVAVLADIHGNAAALEAVLEDLERVAPDRLLLNGDLLTLGPEPVETAALLRRLQAPSTRGNTDRWLAEAAAGRRAAGVTDEILENLRWTVGLLDPAERRAFSELPFALAAEPLRALLYHGSEAGDEQGVWPDTPAGEMPALFPGTPSGTVIVSHTHIPGERTQEALRVLNTGSVGFPFDGDTRACYLVLEGDPGSEPAPEWRRVAYNRERTLRAIREREVPMAARLAQRIQTGEF